MNIVVLLARLSRPAEERQLPSEDHLVQLEVTVAREGAKSESVPVVWFGAPAWAKTLDVNDEILVIGRVRRRFFRTGGSTQSRTEVVADTVVPARQAKKVAAALERARTAIADVVPA